MPTEVYPVGRAADVLLVCADWRLRAPLRAQLVEDGHDVTALETWDEAELLLRTRALRPRAIVFDLEGDSNPQASLATLARRGDPAPVVVLTSLAALPAGEVRALGFVHVLPRPFMIRDVEAALRRVLPLGGVGGPSPPPAT